MLCGICSLPAQAAVLNIEATFVPDSAAPHKNEFVNKTPSQGFCLQLPLACKAEAIFSLIAPISFTANAPIRANHTDPRQGGMASVPSQWSDVEVTHSSGDKHTVKVRIAGIGHESLLPIPIEKITGATGGAGWDRLWQGGSWMYAPSPCQGVGWSTVGEFGFNSFWKVPQGAGVCAKQALFDIPLPFKYQYFVFGYQLITPNPLNMQSGNYTGSITFSVGPRQDFDMGDVMQPDDTALTLNFNLDVQHTLKVDIPPGGEKVQLVPEGGWQSWLQAGRRPVRLFRDQTFNISASSRFKMHIYCNGLGGYDCVIEDRDARNAVELQVSVSLPDGLTDLSGQPVRRQRLRKGEANAQQFQPGFYVDRAPGILHFEVPQSQMVFMLSPGKRGFYSGGVTVIWDSEV
ncbi:hypothetical protein FQ185_25515 [Pseudomonas sp. ANT_H12B]|nr:hypothetical protein FQ185_25515 [Pseudomonas sp. ANT_H12B]